MRTISSETKGKWVLGMSTFVFAAFFAVWIVFSIIGKPIQKELALSDFEFGWLIAMPILTGSLSRPFFGVWGDRYGGREVLTLLMAGVSLPLFLVGWATAYWQFLILGFLLGFAGASFAVGTAYVAKWWPEEKRGFVMGVFGAGNLGAAFTQFVAPHMISAWGWRAVPQLYGGGLILLAIAFYLLTYTDEHHKVRTGERMRIQFQTLLKDMRVWRYLEYYAVCFGGFVALALWMPAYYMKKFGFTLAEAGMLVAIIFTFSGSISRIAGGWLADRYGAYRVTHVVVWTACFFLFFMAYPHFGFAIFQDGDAILGFEYTLPWWGFTMMLAALGVAFGIGNGAIFKCAARNFPHNGGAVFGLIGMGGGLGGFLLPILFGALYDFAKFPEVCFWPLFFLAWLALWWLHWAKHNEGCACSGLCGLKR